MTREEISAEVLELVEDNYSERLFDMNEDINLSNTLDMDSLDKIELAMALEAKYTINIPDQIIADSKTPRGYIDYIDGVLNPK